MEGGYHGLLQSTNPALPWRLVENHENLS